MTARTVMALGLFAMACSSGQQGNLSVSARSSTAATDSNGASTSSASIDLGNGISLDRIRVVIRKLKLEGNASSSSATMLTASGAHVAHDGGSSGGSGSGDSGSDGSGKGSDGSGSSSGPGSSGAVTVHDGGDDGKTEVEHESDDADEPVVGPLFADLTPGAIGSGLEQLFQGAAPAGTFDELKFVVGPISAAQAKGDANLEAMAAQKASIVVDGTIDGKAFTFVSGLVAEFQIEGQITVSATSTTNITISIDPKSWFGGTGTARLDPTNPADQSAIEDAIKQSIKGFQDDDRHGDDDHASEGGGDDGSGHS